MEAELGDRVVTADGHEIGIVKHVVLAAQTGVVTSIVIEKGFLLPDDILAPIDIITSRDDGRLNLRLTSAEAADLPKFDPFEFKSGSGQRLGGPTGFATGEFLWPIGYPPFPSEPGVFVPVPIPSDPSDSTESDLAVEAKKTRDVTLEIGSEVVSSDGESLGTIHGIGFDPTTGVLQHIVVRRGVLFAHDFRLGAEHIASTTSGVVSLTLERSELEAHQIQG